MNVFYCVFINFTRQHNTVYAEFFCRNATLGILYVCLRAKNHVASDKVLSEYFCQSEIGTDYSVYSLLICRNCRFDGIVKFVWLNKNIKRQKNFYSEQMAKRNCFGKIFQTEIFYRSYPAGGADAHL